MQRLYHYLCVCCALFHLAEGRTQTSQILEGAAAHKATQETARSPVTLSDVLVAFGTTSEDDRLEFVRSSRAWRKQVQLARAIYSCSHRV